MTTYRVKAYFMHEHEEQAAREAAKQSLITKAVWTPSYVLGVVNKSDIPRLAKKGLLVSVVEEVLPPASKQVKELAMATVAAQHRQLRASTAVAREQTGTKRRVLSRSDKRTEYYIVRFHGPLTGDRERELKKSGIHLLERITRNKYTARLKPTEVDALEQLPFVDTVRLYTAADTLREPGDRAAADRQTRVYSVRVHRAQDIGAVVKWLRSKRRKPLAKGRNWLRVALESSSKLLADLAARPEVAIVEPVAVARTLGDHARKILQLDVVAHNPGGLDGTGEIVGIADTGIDEAHPDFKNRIVGRVARGRRGDSSDPDGHGTHVAGCVAGDGTASAKKIRGAAPKAKIFFQSILDENGGLGGLPDDLEQLFQEAYAQGARIHNNSWGAYAYARYTQYSMAVDRFVERHPDMLIVIAAGNDGIGVPRVRGTPMKSGKGFVDWPCVGAPATAKNGLTVGASRNSRRSGGYAALTWNDAWPDKYPHRPISGESISGDGDCLAAFSSRGPTDDQRIKPDVVAPGTDIVAARSKDAPLRNFWGSYPSNRHYAFMGGTSMAAPYVAGCAALVRQWYRTKGKWATPSAALLKATLINGTMRIGGADATAPDKGDPNYHQGFGRIHMAGTLPNGSPSGFKLEYVDTWKTRSLSLRAGERRRFQVKVLAGAPLRICLAWTDPGARALQNTLVLMADNPRGKKWAGNANVAIPFSVPGSVRDANNNVQAIRIDKPTAGEYTIAVVGDNVLLPPQTFALVVTGKLGSKLVSIS